MLSHSSIWAAIDDLAKRHGLSASGLARRAGLDPTSFNPSKRVAKDGRARWPSTESLSKVLTATGEPFEIFVQYFGGDQIYRQNELNSGMPMPLIGLTQANVPGFLDSGGLPVGSGWDEMQFPGPDEEGTYALPSCKAISGSSDSRDSRVILSTKDDRNAPDTSLCMAELGRERVGTIIAQRHWFGPDAGFHWQRPEKMGEKLAIARGFPFQFGIGLGGINRNEQQVINAGVVERGSFLDCLRGGKVNEPVGNIQLGADKFPGSLGRAPRCLVSNFIYIICHNGRTIMARACPHKN